MQAISEVRYDSVVHRSDWVKLQERASYYYLYYIYVYLFIPLLNT